LAEYYDLIVIGGGPGGYVAAIRAAQKGLKTALVEERDIGGTCLNRGCIPTKALLHAAGLYRQVLEGERLGIFTEGLRYDLDAMYGRKDGVVTQLRGGIIALLEANGVTLISGKAQVLEGNRVKVTGNRAVELSGKAILIATGAAPQRPKLPGADLPKVLTSDELLAAPPKGVRHLVVIGGGVIGVELASVYGNLGCAVTILEAQERILTQADREVSQNLSMILKKRGMTIHTGAMVQEIKEEAEGLSLRFAGKKGEELVQGDVVLLSIGRRSRLDGLFGEGLIPQMTPKGLVVDESYETSLPGVFAIGDCVDGSIQLAHVAAAQAGNFVSLLLGEEEEQATSVVPSCIYTEPEIAWVGLSADEAKAKGLTVKSSKYPMTGNGKSVIEEQDRGFIKLVFDAQSEKLLGAQLMCGRATDLVGELTAAVLREASAKDLASVIRPHPTFGEGIGEAVEALFDRAVHLAPKRKK